MHMYMYIPQQVITMHKINLQIINSCKTTFELLKGNSKNTAICSGCSKRSKEQIVK